MACISLTFGGAPFVYTTLFDCLLSFRNIYNRTHIAVEVIKSRFIFFIVFVKVTSLFFGWLFIRSCPSLCTITNKSMVYAWLSESIEASAITFCVNVCVWYQLIIWRTSALKIIHRFICLPRKHFFFLLSNSWDNQHNKKKQHTHRERNEWFVLKTNCNKLPEIHTPRNRSKSFIKHWILKVKKNKSVNWICKSNTDQSRVVVKINSNRC